jgi:mannose-6-phosphate isomerase-like protein (cupin superfamily)
MSYLRGLGLWSVLSAVLGLGCVAAVGQAVAAPADRALAQSKVFPFDEMTVRTTASGGWSRDVVHGALKTGEVVGMHESMQPVGAAPVALHAIQHSELIMVQEGTVVFEHDGKEERVGPGGVIYVAFGTVHRVKNVGNVPAKYFVLQVGGDTKR